MNLRIVIPVRDPNLGKSRLAGVLDAEERRALNLYFFLHTLEVAIAAADSSNCFVISRSQQVLNLAEAVGAHALYEVGADLNASLEQAAEQVGGNAPLLSLSTDLPMLSTDDLIAMMTRAGNVDVLIAGDRARTGTNAMLLARPGLIPYTYGIRSLNRHADAAMRAGHRCEIIFRDGLACDVDTPADLIFTQLSAA